MSLTPRIYCRDCGRREPVHSLACPRRDKVDLLPILDARNLEISQLTHEVDELRYQLKKASAGPWIPVSERLPEPQTIVLAWSSIGSARVVWRELSVAEAGRWWWRGPGVHLSCDHFTHWAPLVAPEVSP